MKMKLTYRLTACIVLVLSLGLAAQANARKPKVLFIALADLRPQLGCYGVAQMQPPNIDRPAPQALVFQRSSGRVPPRGH